MPCTTRPELDVDRCTDPVTGEPGLHVALLAADGSTLEEYTAHEWTGWLRDVRPDADAVRLRARVRLDEPGVHELGVGTVGMHRVTIDGARVAEGGTRVDEGIVLSSGHNHPIAELATAGGTAVVDATLQVVHAVGYGHFVRAALVHRLPGPSAEDELAAAVEAAAAADVAVVLVGTTAEVESEGYDRPDLDLPGNQDELVRRVVAANPRTVVVVNAGAPVLLPWLDEVPTVLWGWLPGQEAGTALADVLTGVTEPTGRLPWTLPARFEDVPVPHARPVDGVVDYVEGTDVGYRAWERRRDAGPDGAAPDAPVPAAPFGHGLGWTTWEYEDAVLARGEAHDAPATLTVYVTVRNTGRRAGREVVQVYVEAPDGGPSRPVRWLGGFAVADVPAMGSATVRVPVPARALQVWDPQAKGWTTPPGTYRLRTGRSVADLRLTNELTVRPGDDPGAGTEDHTRSVPHAREECKEAHREDSQARRRGGSRGSHRTAGHGLRRRRRRHRRRSRRRRRDPDRRHAERRPDGEPQPVRHRLVGALARLRVRDLRAADDAQPGPAVGGAEALARRQREWNEDFTEAVITPREGVTWSDGEEFTADDVAFSIQLRKDFEALNTGALPYDNDRDRRHHRHRDVHRRAVRQPVQAVRPGHGARAHVGRRRGPDHRHQPRAGRHRPVHARVVDAAGRHRRGPRRLLGRRAGGPRDPVLVVQRQQRPDHGAHHR